MKKFLALFLVLALSLGMFAGCSSKAADKGAAAGEEKKEPLKVGLLLPGPINDMGWNASAYEGLMQVKKDFGADVTYMENVQQSDMEEAFRNFAMQGFDVVFGHGFQFGDAATAVSKEFPDTKFVITSSNINNGTNLASVNAVNEDQGFLAGALAALLSKSGKVGAIGGTDIPPIRGSLQGFAAGAKHVNPNIQVDLIVTGSFDDVNKAKETALALTDKGVDVIFANANQAGLGSIEACKERGILAIGSNTDQNSIAPETVAASVIKSVPRLLTFIVGEVANGTFEGKFYPLSIKEKAVFFADWHGFDKKYPEAIAEVNKITEDLANGKITYNAADFDF